MTDAEAARMDDEAMRLEQLKAALLGSAATLYGAQKVASDHVRQKSKASFGRMVDAHLLVSGVLAGALLRTVALHVNLDKTPWLTRETFTAQAASFSRC